MSAEIRILPTNIWSHPDFCDLLPDQKLLMIWLWVNPAVSSAGVQLFDAGIAGVATSLQKAAVTDAIIEFERRSLVVYDQMTGELFITKWFRWHRFNDKRRWTVLQADLKKIESRKISEQVLNAVAHIEKPAEKIAA
jgi:hypothetical protein